MIPYIQSRGWNEYAAACPMTVLHPFADEADNNPNNRHKYFLVLDGNHRLSALKEIERTKPEMIPEYINATILHPRMDDKHQLALVGSMQHLIIAYFILSDSRNEHSSETVR